MAKIIIDDDFEDLEKPTRPFYFDKLNELKNDLNILDFLVL